jgi:hypothetical protein
MRANLHREYGCFSRTAWLIQALLSERVNHDISELLQRFENILATANVRYELGICRSSLRNLANHTRLDGQHQSHCYCSRGQSDGGRD